MKSINNKILILLSTLILAVILCGAVSAASTISYSPNGKNINITNTYTKSTLQTHVNAYKRTGIYGYGTYSTVTFSGKDLKGRDSYRLIKYFNGLFKTSNYLVTDHKGFSYTSKATAGRYGLTGTVSGTLNAHMKFSGTTSSPFMNLNGQKLIKQSSGFMKFYQDNLLFAKIQVQDTPLYKLYSGQYQLLKVRENTNTFFTNGNSRKSVISSYYTRNSLGTLVGQKTYGTSSGSEKINNVMVKYTGKIYITTRYDAKDAFNEKFIFGDYKEAKSSTSPTLLKIYPFEAINFS
jgi:hypothetical protein